MLFSKGTLSNPRFTPWISGILATIASFSTLSAIGCYRNRVVGIGAFFVSPDQPANVVLSIIIGAIVGALFSDKFRPYRKYLFWLLLVVLAIAGISANAPVSYFTWFLIAAVAVYQLLKDRAKAGGGKPDTFGSAEWADRNHILTNKLNGEAGFWLGTFQDGKGAPVALHYTGDRHLLTIAPTRAGKGVSAIIPNLLTYTGSAIVIDPKGENALITSAQRRQLGQSIHVVDPWGITGLPSSRFNPLDWLKADDPDVGENALMLAEAIVVRSGGGDDRFWDDEAIALLWGFILYAAIHPSHDGERSLGGVRELISSSREELDVILAVMAKSDNDIIASTAVRTFAKEDKVRSNVFTTLQSHTHFLDSPRMKESLSESDFRFEDLKSTKGTVYLVLPADRLNTFGRWLRLLIQQAITVNARNIELKPDKPILFLLDEMAALGKLTKLEEAYSLMAGFGMQLWGIVQDISQLDRIYDKGWETFIGNSGVLQYFGSRDMRTADYFSKLCGVSTVIKVSIGRSIARAFKGGGSVTDSTNTDHIQRHLAFPDELMVLRKNQSLLLVENFNPIKAQKITWYNDQRLMTKGRNLQQPKAPAPNQ